MKAHRIVNTVSGLTLGVLFGCDNSDEALEALESDAATPVNRDDREVEEALILMVCVKGGDAQNSHDAIALDLDRGQARDHEWAALVSLRSLYAFIHNTGAELVRAEPWTGERFGDGSCGAIEILDEGLQAMGGCYDVEGIIEQLFVE